MSDHTVAERAEQSVESSDIDRRNLIRAIEEVDVESERVGGEARHAEVRPAKL